MQNSVTWMLFHQGWYCACSVEKLNFTPSGRDSHVNWMRKKSPR